MSCCDCLTAAVFAVLSVLTTGLTAALTISAFVLIKVKKIDILSDALHIGLILGVVAVTLAFLFSIWASCFGKRCAKGALGLIFVVFAAAFAALGIAMLLQRGAIKERASTFWQHPEAARVYEVIEDAFNCSCFNEAVHPSEETCDPGKPTCEAAIGHALDKYGVIVAGCALGVSVLMLVGAGLAFSIACCRKGERSEDIMYGGYRLYG